MKTIVALCVLFVCYGVLLVPFTDYMAKRPIALKLGSVPDAQVLKFTTGDQRYLVANYFVTKVLFYFGTYLDRDRRAIVDKPQYFNMFKTLETAVRLDPYNLDAYYFMQAAFTWELSRAKDVNRVLAYGMRYRTWDYQLPFYAGFNAAYFLKDYAAAATYMSKAAELSGEPLFTNLAARYFYESGETDLGVVFLESMMKSARDPKVKKLYKMRRDALKVTHAIQSAVTEYRSRNQGRLPSNLYDLVEAGILPDIPPDPYGGVFQLDNNGKVVSTSKFAPIMTDDEDTKKPYGDGGGQ